MLSLTPAARGARNAGLLALANTGSGRSTIVLFEAEGGLPVASRTLSSPCGELTGDGRIRLIPDSSVEDMILVSAEITYAEWRSADDELLAYGTVTDMAGAGPWKLAGTSGTSVYAGGLISLTEAVVG